MDSRGQPGRLPPHAFYETLTNPPPPCKSCCCSDRCSLAAQPARGQPSFTAATRTTESPRRSPRRQCPLSPPPRGGQASKRKHLRRRRPRSHRDHHRSSPAHLPVRPTPPPPRPASLRALPSAPSTTATESSTAVACLSRAAVVLFRPSPAARLRTVNLNAPTVDLRQEDAPRSSPARLRRARSASSAATRQSAQRTTSLASTRSATKSAVRSSARSTTQNVRLTSWRWRATSSTAAGMNTAGPVKTLLPCSATSINWYVSPRCTLLPLWSDAYQRWTSPAPVGVLPSSVLGLLAVGASEPLCVSLRHDNPSDQPLSLTRFERYTTAQPSLPSPPRRCRP